MTKSSELTFHFNHNDDSNRIFFFIFFKNQSKNEKVNAPDKIYDWVLENVANVEYEAEFLFSIPGALISEGKLLYNQLMELGLSFDQESQDYVYTDSPLMKSIVEGFKKHGPRSI